MSRIHRAIFQTIQSAFTFHSFLSEYRLREKKMQIKSRPYEIATKITQISKGDYMINKMK